MTDIPDLQVQVRPAAMTSAGARIATTGPETLERAAAGEHAADLGKKQSGGKTWEKRGNPKACGCDNDSGTLPAPRRATYNSRRPDRYLQAVLVTH